MIKMTHSELIAENETLIWAIAGLKAKIKGLESDLVGYQTLIEHHAEHHQEINECKHDWIVYSTAVVSKVIMARCEKCGAEGSIGDYTDAEWAAAFYAPSHPYPWGDAERVEILWTI